MKSWSIVISIVMASVAVVEGAEAQPLATLEHNVVGAKLSVAPGELFVPKDIPGSLAVDIISAGGATDIVLGPLSQGTHVEGVLRGPAFPAYRLLGLPNEPLMLPPIALTGEYRIDDLRLVDTATGDVLMMGVPSSVLVHVFPHVLVSHVESRPLTLDEITARGIVIDASSFSAVEFEAVFVIGGASLPVRFPVVTPKFKPSTDIIPRAELDARLAEAERINRELAKTVPLPPELMLPGLDIEIQGTNFQRAGGDEDEADLAMPSIPGLIVIPGNVGFLNQFFSVQVFTANAAPRGSGVAVLGLEARIVLPNGKDFLPSTSDDPVALARTADEPQPVDRLPILTRGRDGQWRSSGGEPRLEPGGTGRAEFIVEGRKPGLHQLDLHLTGTLDGFAHGEVPIEGRAVGSVLVRNPKFSIVFAHPHTIRAGEPYTASITVLNTSEVPANLVSVNLNAASISGAILDPAQSEQIDLGTIESGESATAEYQLIAQSTGQIIFSNLTGDDDLTGRFDLTMAVDERGVALSSQTIGYPDWVLALPPAVRRAADRVLGQALSVATAATLPPGVRSIEASLVKARVIELAEAGQRLRYGDAPASLYLDLLLDWHGGRSKSLGFDQILRSSSAGRELETAVLGAVDAAATSGLSWALAHAGGVAGRGETWSIASTDNAAITPHVTIDGVSTSSLLERLTESGAYLGASGWILPILDTARRPGLIEVTFEVPALGPSGQVAWMSFDGQGGGSQIQLTVSPDASDRICYRYFPSIDAQSVTVDVACDGTSDGTLATTGSSISESAPILISATQDLKVRIGRPFHFCGGPSFDHFGVPTGYGNYGTLVAALFSKPMSQASVQAAGAFRLDNGVPTNGVALQPGGRVALVNLRNGVRASITRTLIASGITDERGAGLLQGTVAIGATAAQGVSISGRVIAGEGGPVSNVPVTLTMHDSQLVGGVCQPVEVRPSQVTTDPDGRFTFDFVMAGLGYTLATTDTRGMHPEAVAFLLEASPEGPLDPSELERLIRDSTALAELMAFLGTSDVQGSIATAEGIDRATFRDHITLNSPRIGSEVPVALRFRGRGTVFGTVYESDGITPVRDAAVNLFPDVGSRELGRGVFSSQAGTFQFYGVPVGPFTLEGGTVAGQQAIVAGVLDAPGDTQEIDLVLSSAAVPRGDLRGTVYEVDGVTPHGGAKVMVVLGQMVVKAGDADADGAFAIDDVAAGSVNLAALSFDGQRIGWRNGVLVQANATVYSSILLPGTSEVVGRVELDNGQPVAGALVAGGDAVVATDSGGNFLLMGVPVGRRRIAAGLEPNPSLGIDFVRLGSTEVDVLPGVTSYAIIRLRPAGRIIGTVRDGAGAPVPNVRVAIPVEGGFYWTSADAQGSFRFENLNLDSYLLAAPAPPVVDVEGSIAAIQAAAAGAADDQLLAALGTTFSLYASGFDVDYDPGSYGFTYAELDLDGETVIADIAYLPEGTVSGQVSNGNFVPIGAAVEIMGVTPGKNGAPIQGLVGAQNSDPAFGTFSFSNVRMGDFTVAASSPFYPAPVTHSGETTLANLDATGIVLQFPPTSAIGGRVTGLVLRDGLPVQAGVRVHINLAPNYEILTVADGTFDTQIDLLAGGYDVEVLDPLTGRVAAQRIVVRAGSVIHIVVELLAADGALDITVLQASSAPAVGAAITVRQISHPRGSYQATSNAAGQASLTNLVEGRYSITACWQSGQSNLCRTDSTDVTGGAVAPIVLTLGGTGTIAGLYVETDGVTPVGFAQIAIGRVAYTTSDAGGAFSIQGIPLGTHIVLGRNAVTGRAARASATLTQVDQTVQVTLREDDLGEVAGRVIDADGSSSVPGALVTITPSNNLFSRVTVTTNPLGRFSFPGVPPGTFVLDASHPNDPLLRGQATGMMPSSVGQVTVDVPFVALAELTLTVIEPTGAPANALVTIPLGSVGTDASGQARLTRLPMGMLSIEARSLVLGQSHSTAIRDVLIRTAGEAPPVTLQLRGVGGVDGTVTNASGAPVTGAQVVLEMDDEIIGPESITALTAANGSFSFDDVALGAVRATASLGALAGSESGSIGSAGSRITLNMALGPSATVLGVLMRADGVSPVPNTNVVIRYDAPSGAAGAAVDRTDGVGAFSFDAIPEGPFILEASVPYFDGVLFHVDAIPAGQTQHDVGFVLLDEEAPRVTVIVPSDGSSGVAVGSNVEITFSEPMDPLVADEDAVYLTNGIAPVAASLSWAAGPNAVTLVLDPSSPLASETTYSLVISAGESRDLDGIVLSRGPVDLAQRPLIAPVVTTFTTADGIPPSILSFTPANGAEQIAVDGVIRVSFSEAMDPASLQLTLTGPGGNVPGSLGAVLNRRVAVYTPSAFLAPNTSYVASLVQATDLAGNSVPSLPRVHGFATLDTIGPSVVDLAVAGNLSLVQGGTATILATLAQPEPGVQIQLTPDLQTYYASSTGSLEVDYPVTQAPGSLTLYAHAVDRFGNHGPWYQETFTVTANQAPQVGIIQTVPSTAPLRTGSAYSFRIDGLDDGGIVRIQGSISGAFTNGLSDPGPGPIFLSGTVPASIGAGQSVTVTAEAEDNAGLIAQATPITVAIADGAAPTLSLSGPGSSVNPGDLVTIDVTTTDAFGVTSLTLQTTGALTMSDGGPITPSTSYSRTFTFTVPANAAGGASILATVVASDAAGNSRAEDLSFTVAMQTTPGPRITAIAPADNATNRSLRPTIEYQFDAPVDAGTISASTLTLEAEVGGAITPTTMTALNGNHLFRFVPAQPLLPGAVYRLRLAGTPTGNGNPIRNPAGLTFTELLTRFTPARIDVLIAGGPRGVEGFGSTAQLVAESAAPVTAATWRLDGADVGSSVGSSPVFNLPIPTLAANPSGVTVAGAMATVTSIGLVTVPSLTIAIHSAGGDFDLDGITNGTERVFGLDPWIADAAADPDQDGLTNAQEVAMGTNPFNSDTDGDSLLDGVDPQPLVGNRRPGAGLIAGSHLSFDGTADLVLPSSTRIQPPFALEAWVHPTADGAFLDSGTNDAIRIAYASAAFSFTLATSGQAPVSYTAPFSSAAGAWHHVALVYDGTQLRAYVDGWLAVEVARSGPVSYTAELTRVDPAFRGRLDELRVWSIPRSAASIMDHMHRAVPASEPGLFASYRLDDGAGAIAGDETGNGNDATIVSPIWLFTNRAPVHQDARIQVGSGQAVLQLEATDLDGDPLAYVVTRLPGDGRLYEFDASTTIGAEITAVPHTVGNAERRVVYTANVGFFGVDRIEYHAADLAGGSLTASVELETPASKVWTGADATAPYEWSRGDNWSPAGLPVATDSVQIPGGVALPITLSSNVEVAGFSIGAGSILDIGAHGLEITSHAANDGEIRGSGTVVLSGANVVAHGAFGNLDVSGTLALDGDLAASDLRIVSPGALAVGPHSIGAGVDLTIGGALVMTDPQSIVDVEGNLTVIAGCAGGQPVLTAGTLSVGGDFIAGDCGGLDALQMSGTHLVILDGMMPQTVSVPSSSLTNSHFRHLTVTNTSGVTLTTDAVITGTLTLSPGAALSSTMLIDTNALDLGTNATLGTLGRLRVQASATLAAGAVVSAGAFETGATLTIAPSAAMTATQLEITAESIPSNVGFTDLFLDADILLTQLLNIPGNLEIGPSGALRLGGFTVQVGGSLSVLGALEMTNASDILDVAGNASLGTNCVVWFPPPDPQGWLVRGTVFLGGNLLASACGLAVASTHRIVFDGSVPQSAAELSYGQIELAPAAQVTFTNDLFAHAITIAAGATFIGQAVSLTGALSTATGSSLSATQLTLDAPDLASVAGTVSVGLVILNGGTTVPSLAYQDLRINWPLSLAANVMVRHLTLNAELTVAGRSLTVLGDLVATRGLEMTNALDEVEVMGNASFGGAGCVTGQGSTLSIGTLRLHGDLSQLFGCVDALRASTSHVTVFEGTAVQSISFVNPSAAFSHLGTVEIASDAEIVGASLTVLAMGALTAGANAMVTGQRLEVQGAFSTAAGSSLSLTRLTLSAANPSLGGSLSAGLVILDGAITTVPPWTYQDLEIRAPMTLASDVTAEDLTVLQSQGGALTIAGRHLTLTGGLSASGPLHMTNAADQVDVAGLATFGGSGCSSSSPSNLTAGVLRLASFSQATCSNAFVASQNHVTRFQGASGSLNFANGADSHFASFEVAPSASVFTSAATTGATASTATVDGTLTITTNKNFTVQQTLQIGAAGVITVQGTGTLTLPVGCPAVSSPMTGPLTCP